MTPYQFWVALILIVLGLFVFLTVADFIEWAH